MTIRLSDHFGYRRLLRFTLPSIAMMIFTSIDGVVDGLFVSNFVGKTPFAAVNLIMPFLMVPGALGFMFGSGGCALIARMLGEGRRKKANQTFSLLIAVTLVCGVVLAALGIALLRPIAALLGAQGELLELCVLYGRVNLLALPALMLQYEFQSFMIAAEKPNLGRMVTVASGVTNMALDALFIAVLRWGVAGAAIATGLSQCVGGVLPLIYFLRPNSSLLHLRPTALRLRPILQACGNGSSELMSNISSSLVSMLYNFQLLRLIGENGVSAYGVLMYVQFIFVAIFIGYSIGCAPIVSYHYGARNHPELKSLLRKSVLLMAIGGVMLSALARLLASPLSHLFVGYDTDLCALTTHAFTLFSWSFLLVGFNIFASGFFTALNNGAISAAISFLRTLVFQSGAVLLLPLLLDVDGIWWAITAAECFAFLISAIFLVAKRNKYHYM